MTILDFGGSGDGVTDNLAAFGRALASNPKNASVGFPPGKYLFSAKVNCVVPNVANAAVSISGAGQDVTELYWPNANGGIEITLPTQGANLMNNAFHVERLTLSTGIASGGNAISVIGLATSDQAGSFTPQCGIDHVTARGSEGYWSTAPHFYWTNGVLINDVNNIVFDTFNVTGRWDSSIGYSSSGNGVYILKGTGSFIPVVYKFVNCSFNVLNRGIVYGAATQGVEVTQCEFVGNDIGIWATGVSDDPINVRDGLWIVNSEFNCWTAGVFVDAGQSIADFLLSNSHFYVPRDGAYGVALLANLRSVINGNIFASIGVRLGVGVTVFGTVGRSASGGKLGGLLSNNLFDSLNLGWAINADAYNWRVANNHCYDNGTDYFNLAGASTICDVPTDCSAAVSMAFGGGSVGGFASKIAQFRRIGSDVMVDIDFTMNSKGRNAGAFTIRGLPVKSGPLGGTGTVGYVSGMTNISGGIMVRVDANSATASLYLSSPSGMVPMTDGNFTDQSRIAVSLRYLAVN